MNKEPIIKDVSGPLADVLEAVLPTTDEDINCLQKRLIKRKNRDLLKRVILTLFADPYGAYTFKEYKPGE